MENTKEITIELLLKNRETGEVIAKRESLGFEGAEEDLGKLERFFKKATQDLASLEDLWNENEIPDHDCKLRDKGFCPCSANRQEGDIVEE